MKYISFCYCIINFISLLLIGSNLMGQTVKGTLLNRVNHNIQFISTEFNINTSFELLGIRIEEQKNKVMEESIQVVDMEVVENSVLKEVQILKEFLELKNEVGEEFSIPYAKITGLQDREVETKVNQILKTAVTNWVDKSCEWARELKV